MQLNSPITSCGRLDASPPGGADERGELRRLRAELVKSQRAREQLEQRCIELASREQHLVEHQITQDAKYAELERRLAAEASDLAQFVRNEVSELEADKQHHGHNLRSADEFSVAEFLLDETKAMQ